MARRTPTRTAKTQPERTAKAQTRSKGSTHAKPRPEPRPKPPWHRDRDTEHWPEDANSSGRGSPAYPDDYYASEADEILGALATDRELTYEGHGDRRLRIRLVTRTAGHAPTHGIADWAALELTRNWRPWRRGADRGPGRTRLVEHVACSYPPASHGQQLTPPPGTDPDAWADARAQLRFRLRQCDQVEDGRTTADPIRGRDMPRLTHADVEDARGAEAAAGDAHAETAAGIARRALAALDHDPNPLALARIRHGPLDGPTLTILGGGRRNQHLRIAIDRHGSRYDDEDLSLHDAPHGLRQAVLAELVRATATRSERYRTGERMALVTPGPVPTAREIGQQRQAYRDGRYAAWRASLHPTFRAALDRLAPDQRTRIHRECAPPVPHAPAGTRHRRSLLQTTRRYGVPRAERRAEAERHGHAGQALADAVAALSQAGGSRNTGERKSKG